PANQSYFRRLPSMGARHPVHRAATVDSSPGCRVSPPTFCRWSLTMPVLEAVQTFAGITNENEFYSHHYLAEVFKGDIKARLDAWDALEAEHAGEEARRAPYKRLQT